MESCAARRAPYTPKILRREGNPTYGRSLQQIILLPLELCDFNHLNQLIWKIQQYLLKVLLRDAVELRRKTTERSRLGRCSERRLPGGKRWLQAPKEIFFSCANTQTKLEKTEECDTNTHKGAASKHHRTPSPFLTCHHYGPGALCSALKHYRLTRYDQKVDC